uniref:SHSP domain-containing protein n=1 Tax=Eimeria tenella TaxID=5802 RepID=H9B9S3_EIMTE|nr:hypothetical protein [Eimeria tenella]
MDPPRSPFEALYGELWDSLNRFDSLMQQHSFFSPGFWWRPYRSSEAQQQQQQLAQQQQQLQDHQQRQLAGAGPAGAQQQGLLSPWSSSSSGLLQWPASSSSSSNWFSHSSCIPRLDIRDTGDNLLLHADLPGLDKKDIKVETQNGRLIIRGHSSSSSSSSSSPQQQQQQQQQQDGRWFVQERCSSSFFRSLPLPPEAQQEKITANYNNGVLEIKVPKNNTSQTTPNSVKVD